MNMVINYIIIIINCNNYKEVLWEMLLPKAQLLFLCL